VGSGNPALSASNLDPRLRGDDKRDRGDDKSIALFSRHSRESGNPDVVPAKAGIQIKKTGFRIKFGMTTL
jgi:hypothetical protein